MSQKKVKTIIEETEPLEQAPEPTQDDLDIESFVSGLGPEVNRVTVYRLDGKTGKYAYCGALPPNEAGGGILAAIQEQFGGGEYWVRLINSRGQFLRQQSVSIEAPRGAAGPGIPGQPAQLAGQPAPGYGPLELLQAQLARQQEMILHLIDKPQPGPNNDLGSLISAVASLRTLADPQQQISPVISALTEGLKLGMKNQSAGPEDKISGILRIVESFKELLPRILPGPGPAVQQPSPPPGNPGPLGSGAVDPGPAPASQNGEMLRQVINYLKSKIGKDPGLWAEWIADNLEEKDWGQLAQFIDKPYSDITRFLGDPELEAEPYRSWFTELLEGLKEQLRGNNADRNSNPPGPGWDRNSSKQNGPIS